MADLRYEVDLKRENIAHFEQNIVPFAVSKGLIKPVNAKEFVESFVYAPLMKKVAPSHIDF